MRYLAGAGRVVCLGLAGLVVGVASVAVHDLTTGLLLALAATAAAAWAVPPGWTTRLPFGAVWSGVAVLASQPRGSGSYLVANNPRGWILLAAAFALLLFSFVTAVRPRPRSAEESGSEPAVS